MKLFRKITLLMVAIMATTVAYGQDSLMIRVMTFNMRFGERASLEDFAKFIKNSHPTLWPCKRPTAAIIALPHRNILDETSLPNWPGKQACLDYSGKLSTLPEDTTAWEYYRNILTLL